MNLAQNRQVKIILSFVIIIVITGITALADTFPEALASPEKLRRQEQKTLAELLEIKLRLESLRTEKLRLEEQLQTGRREKAALEEELAQIRANLTASSKELGKWANFTYRQSYADLAESLFLSQDFGDFINRSFLLWAIMDKQAKAFQTHQALATEAEKSLGKLTELNASLTKYQDELEITFAELRTDEARLKQFLADLRAQSAALEARLNKLTEQWTEVTALTAAIVGQLSTLAESEMAPDSIRFTLGGMRVDYTQDTINRAIKKTADPSAGVRVNIEPQQVIITGKTYGGGVDFRITGNFTVSPDQKQMIFVPGSIIINQATMESEIFKTIIDNSDLAWDITRYYPSFSIVGVKNGPGTITVNLRY
ncbi:MAG: hypothetical protein MJA84_03980 [Firmicutes bacterium]|nr:hypothetical protein [Bacillota bacterium]